MLQRILARPKPVSKGAGLYTLAYVAFFILHTIPPSEKKDKASSARQLTEV